MGFEGQGRSAQSDRHIYVVDDEPMLLELVSVILRPAGYEVAGFRSGEAALQAYLAAPHKPALLITDFAMGLGMMSGLELVGACRQVNPRQKVLLLSGTVDETAFKDALQKPDAFLAKPYRPAELTAIVRRLITD